MSDYTIISMKKIEFFGITLGLLLSGCSSLSGHFISAQDNFWFLDTRFQKQLYYCMANLAGKSGLPAPVCYEAKTVDALGRFTNLKYGSKLIVSAK